MAEGKELEYIIEPTQKGKRLDQFLAQQKELGLSRSQVQKLIEEEFITVNKAPAKPSYLIKTDDRIKVTVPPPPSPKLIPENLPLDIIYEDEDLIVVNKPKGMVVHPAAGNFSGTLVNALLYHCDHLATSGGPIRPGIVHRLDKDTSGLLVVAKTDLAYQDLVKQIKNRAVERTYLALVHGNIKNDQGIIEARIGRHPVHRKKMAVTEGIRTREAITHYKVLQRFKNYTLVEVKIKTGRTHQIRVHMSYLGHPVVGDKTYGKKKEEFEVSGQLLHAQKLAFLHPRTGQILSFKAPLPKEMQQILTRLSQKKI